MHRGSFKKLMEVIYRSIKPHPKAYSATPAVIRIKRQPKRREKSKGKQYAESYKDDSIERSDRVDD